MSITSGFTEDWAAAEHKFIFFTGTTAQAYTLCDASEKPGQTFTLKNQSTAAVTVTPIAGQTIDGASTLSLATQYTFSRLVSDGHNWNVI